MWSYTFRRRGTALWWHPYQRMSRWRISMTCPCDRDRLLPMMCKRIRLCRTRHKLSSSGAHVDYCDDIPAKIVDQVGSEGIIIWCVVRILCSLRWAAIARAPWWRCIVGDFVLLLSWWFWRKWQRSDGTRRDSLWHNVPGYVRSRLS